jgi:alkanesulfonate monooxygenase SsuD/methylene tetrahydromethanopterin reductase-like flavin-dependent oxidoreductase (luciferase family)
LELSVFYELETSDPSPESVRRIYKECVEQVQLADQLGYRAVWFTEHHFLERFSYSSAPEEVLAFLAAKTNRIRLGHGIVLLPFNINHPVRVAERIAVLDTLSNGRVEFGGGRAICESELSAFHVHPDVTRPQWEEALAMLPRMWTEDKFKWDGKLIQVPERAVIPKPVQQPHPPMSIACTQASTVEFAGEHGLGVLGFGISEGVSNEYVRTYREKIRTAKPIGKFVNNRFAVLRMALCSPNDREALDLQGANSKMYSHHTRELFAPWIDGKAPASYAKIIENFVKGFAQLDQVSIEDVVKMGGACIGDVSRCVDSLQFLEDAGVDEVMLFMQLYTTPHDQIMRSIDLFANKVLPRIRPRSDRGAEAR